MAWRGQLGNITRLWVLYPPPSQPRASQSFPTLDKSSSVLFVDVVIGFKTVPVACVIPHLAEIKEAESRTNGELFEKHSWPWKMTMDGAW